MEYHEAVAFLFDLRRYPPAVGVESTRRLLDRLGRPDEDLRVVQVAGSNGKGSTARMVECVLRKAGLEVGLFTSPHLDDVRERVRIDGRPVSKAAVAEFVERTEPHLTGRAADGDPPTFFETTTALSVWAFAREDVDVAVLEVGIGGRYDATSALEADVAAVTSVTLEHTDLLGDTVEAIARDTAAVAPRDRPLVTATTGAARQAIAAETAVRRVGETDDADLQVATDGRDGVEQSITLTGEGWTASTHLPLLGPHQARNAGVAAALARQLADVTARDVERGLRNAHWPGRFEVMAREPLVVLDGAHNPGGCAALAATLSTFAYDDLHLVVGAMQDKDHAEMAAALPDADAVYACRPAFERAETPEVLAAAFDGGPRRRRTATRRRRGRRRLRPPRGPRPWRRRPRDRSAPRRRTPPTAPRGSPPARRRAGRRRRRRRRAAPRPSPRGPCPASPQRRGAGRRTRTSTVSPRGPHSRQGCGRRRGRRAAPGPSPRTGPASGRSAAPALRHVR